jgi:hypothetical protein
MIRGAFGGHLGAGGDGTRNGVPALRWWRPPAAAATGLRGLAAVATVHDDARRAATLLGAADAHRYGAPADAIDDRLESTFFEVARARQGVEAWKGAIREGAALSLDDAIAYGLEEARS